MTRSTVSRRQRLEALQLEQARLEAQQQAGIGGLGQDLRARPAGGPFGAAEDGGEPVGQSGAPRAKACGTSAKPLNGGPPMNFEPVMKTIAPRAR